MLSTRDPPQTKGHIQTESEGLKKTFYANGDQNKAGVTILVSDKINFEIQTVKRNKAFDCMDPNKLWKILKKMGIPDHLTCLLRNLYAGQEATVRTGHGTTDWFQIGKGIHQGCIFSPCFFF